MSLVSWGANIELNPKYMTLNKKLFEYTKTKQKKKQPFPKPQVSRSMSVHLMITWSHGAFCKDPNLESYDFQASMWVFPKNRGKPPKWMVNIMENPMNKWMIWGVFTHYFWKHPCFFCFHNIQVENRFPTSNCHLSSPQYLSPRNLLDFQDTPSVPRELDQSSYRWPTCTWYPPSLISPQQHVHPGCNKNPCDIQCYTSEK